MTTTTKPEPSPIDITILEGIRNYDGVIARKLEGVAPVLADVRENMLDLGEQLLKLREAVSGNTKAMSIYLNRLDLRASKDIRADAQKMARAVRGGKTREEVLALPAREIRLLSPDFARAKSDNPTADEQAKPAKTDWKAIAERALAEKAALEEKIAAIASMPVSGDTAMPAAGNNASQTIDQNEAPSPLPPEDPANDAGADGDAGGGGGGEHGPDVGDASAGTVGSSMDGAGVADESGTVGDAAKLEAIKVIASAMVQNAKTGVAYDRTAIEGSTQMTDRMKSAFFRILDVIYGEAA